MQEPSPKHDQKHPDKYARQWHVTPLGRLIMVVMLVFVGVLLVYSIRPVSSNEAAQKAAERLKAQTSQTSDVQRLLTADDAVDFTQLAYNKYLKDLNKDNPAILGTDGPYDLGAMLQRLESIRGSMGNGLYVATRAAYANAAEHNGIMRDEVACSTYNFDRFQAERGQASGDMATVSIKRFLGATPAGSFEVTVALKTSQITAINCK